MKAKQRQLKLNVVLATAACVGFCACNSTPVANRDGSVGSANGGTGGGRADAALGSGGALDGSGGTSAADAPVGTGGSGQTGGQPGTGGRMATGGTTSNGGTTGPHTGTGGSYIDGGAPGSGGKTGTGGKAIDGGMPGSGGKAGAGGSAIDGGMFGSGGKTGAGGGTGGSYIDGGAPGAGGKTGTGGSTGIDAGLVPRCGGEGGYSCLTGYFCDILDHCGGVSDGSGTCVPTGSGVICDDIYKPVCGCNGKTYPNDCERGVAGIRKFSDGECAAGRDASPDTDRNAGMTWQAAAVGATTGPGIAVVGIGWYVAGTSTTWQDIQSTLFDGTPSGSITNAQLDDLFARLSAIDFSALPHATSGTTSCNAQLMYSVCTSCPRKTLSYSSATQLAPEMEPVWAWFDQVLGSPTVATNPRTYCRQ